MKNNILFIITTIATIYLVKKGSNSAIEKNESLDFPATFNRGLELTLKALSKKINPNIADSENNTRIFAVGLIEM